MIVASPSDESRSVLGQRLGWRSNGFETDTVLKAGGDFRAEESSREIHTVEN